MKGSKLFMNESEAIKKEKKFFILLGFLLLVTFGSGFYLGYEAHSGSMFDLADSYLKGDIIANDGVTIYGSTDCVERAFVLSYWLPFELTEDLKVKDCQEVKWLDEKFQKLYFEKEVLE